MPKLRCLAARNDPEVGLTVTLENNHDKWSYTLMFRAETRGHRRALITQEIVKKNEETIISRPNNDDRKDDERLTQTYLEQINTNAAFRDIQRFFSGIHYLHLIPQLIRHSEQFAVRILERDPYGQAFLESIAEKPGKTRESRLKKINRALRAVVPQLRDLKFVRDEKNGQPHLEARYDHWRPNAGWQREDQFSDGTLRLMGLLWSLLDGDSLLLLEEPELSLHSSIVARIPELIANVQKQKKKRRQVIITTHSEALLSSPGIDGAEIAVLNPSSEGTEVAAPRDNELELMRSGLSPSEVLMGDRTGPEQLHVFTTQ